MRIVALDLYSNPVIVCNVNNHNFFTFVSLLFHFVHVYFWFTLYMYEYVVFTLNMFILVSFCTRLLLFHFVDVHLTIAGYNQCSVAGSETDECWPSALIWKF